MYGYAASGLEPGVHRGLPSDGLSLVFTLDEPLRWASSERQWAEGTRDSQWIVLGGLHTRPAMIEQPGRWSGVQLTLHPLGVPALLGVPCADLPVTEWDATDLIGREADRVMDDLQSAAGWPERYAAVTAFLLRRMRVTERARRRSGPSAEVRQAWTLLTGRFDLGVDHVAREVGYSRRRLNQLMSAEVGHGPKTVQRLARFDKARRAVAAAPTSGVSLAEVAATVGYFDQSHMVRDFNQFAGLGPTAWLAAEFPNLQGSVPLDEGASQP